MLTWTRYISDIPDIFDKPIVDICVGTIDVSQRCNDATTQTASETSHQNTSFINHPLKSTSQI